MESGARRARQARGRAQRDGGGSRGTEEAVFPRRASARRESGVASRDGLRCTSASFCACFLARSRSRAAWPSLLRLTDCISSRTARRAPSRRAKASRAPGALHLCRAEVRRGFRRPRVSEERRGSVPLALVRVQLERQAAVRLRDLFLSCIGPDSEHLARAGGQQVSVRLLGTVPGCRRPLAALGGCTEHGSPDSHPGLRGLPVYPPALREGARCQLPLSVLRGAAVPLQVNV